MKSIGAMPVKVDLRVKEITLLDAYLDHSSLANCKSTHGFIKTLEAENAQDICKLTDAMEDLCFVQHKGLY